MVTFIIVLVIVGLIAGAVARLLVPGRDPIGLIGTIVLGIVGSFVGGFLQNLIQYHNVSIHSFHLVGILGSIIGAIVLLILLRLFHAEPGRRHGGAGTGAGTPGRRPAATRHRPACTERGPRPAGSGTNGASSRPSTEQAPEQLGRAPASSCAGPRRSAGQVPGAGLVDEGVRLVDDRPHRGRRPPEVEVLQRGADRGRLARHAAASPPRRAPRTGPGDGPGTRPSR